MKTKKILSLLLCTVLTAGSAVGCGSSSSSPLNILKELKFGMGEDQVEEILGSDHTSEKDGSEVSWEYEYVKVNEKWDKGVDEVYCTFKNGKLTDVSMRGTFDGAEDMGEDAKSDYKEIIESDGDLYIDEGVESDGNKPYFQVKDKSTGRKFGIEWYIDSGEYEMGKRILI